NRILTAVLEQGRADAVVLSGESFPRTFNRILVPTAGGFAARGAAELAVLYAKTVGAQIDVLHIVETLAVENTLQENVRAIAARGHSMSGSRWRAWPCESEQVWGRAVGRGGATCRPFLDAFQVAARGFVCECRCRGGSARRRLCDRISPRAPSRAASRSRKRGRAAGLHCHGAADAPCRPGARRSHSGGRRSAGSAKRPGPRGCRDPGIGGAWTGEDPPPAGAAQERRLPDRALYRRVHRPRRLDHPVGGGLRRPDWPP